MVIRRLNSDSGTGARLELLMKKHDLNDEALELIAGRFRMLSEPMRLRILNAMSRSELLVTQLVAMTGANQANISKHLSILLHAGIVSRRKEGLIANYRVSDPTIFELCDLVCDRLKDHHETRHTPYRRPFHLHKPQVLGFCTKKFDNSARNNP